MFRKINTCLNSRLETRDVRLKDRCKTQRLLRKTKVFLFIWAEGKDPGRKQGHLHSLKNPVKEQFIEQFVEQL